MAEELRDRVSKLEAKQEMLEKVLFKIDSNILSLIDRVSKLEERVNHLSNRIDRLESEIKGLRSEMKGLRDYFDKKIDSVFWRLVILILASMIIPIILRLLKI